MNKVKLLDELSQLMKDIESLKNTGTQKDEYDKKVQRLEKIKWQLLSEDEKLAKRLEWIAVSKAHDYPDIEKLWLTIKIYEKIRLTRPYIILLNNESLLDSLLKLCQKELSVIDETRLPQVKHVSKSEIEEAFRLFFDHVKLPEEYASETTHPEAEQKVEELYELFCKL